MKKSYCEVEPLKIKEFIAGRNIKYDTVRKYIINNEELFKGHIGRPNNIVLDEEAISILEKKYPLPEPIQVVEDTEARKKLIEAQQMIIELQQQLVMAAPKIAAADQNKYLLEKIENEAEELKEKSKSLEKELKEVTREKQEMENEFKREKAILTKQLETEKSKSWWDKLRKK